METALDTARPEVLADARLERRARLRPQTAWAVGCVTVDAAMLLLAAVAAVVGGHAAGVAYPPLAATAAFVGLCLALYWSRGLYRLRFRLHTLDDLRSIFAATTLAAMIVLTARVLLGSTDDLATESARLWAFALAYVSAGRLAWYWSQQRARVVGESVRPTLIVGAGRVGALVAKRFLDNPELGFRPVAFLDKEPLVDTFGELGIPVAGASWDLDEAIARYRVEQVVITFSTAPDEVLLRIVRRCEDFGVPIAIVPRLFERMPELTQMEHLGGLPLVAPKPAEPAGWQFRVKYAFDRLLAAAALLLLSPFLVAAAIAVWLSVGRPVLFRQLRIGRDGRPFEMLKFRSMAGHAESPYTAPEGDLGPGGVEGADRRTRVGTFLRKTSIDELPQLLNVLRGEMSLIGPRPERPEFVEDFEQRIYRYRERHRVKSGITGWAQVHGLRGRTSLADRAEWDNFYIENFSLWLDLKIALMTLRTLFRSAAAVE
ncbi:MAG TPA: sugar transferase [Gaiellaceae bacterium]|nr:sugar transferase [Gaiellaceae bacterium]